MYAVTANFLVFELNVLLQAPPDTVFPSEALPLTPPAVTGLLPYPVFDQPIALRLSSYPGTLGSMLDIAGPTRGRIFAEITSIARVPESSPLGLAALSLLILAASRAGAGARAARAGRRS